MNKPTASQMEIIAKSWIPTKASDLDVLRNEIISAVHRGEISAIEMIAIAKTYNKLIEGDNKQKNGIADQLMELAIEEFHKYGKGEKVSKLIFDIEESEAGVKYDFSRDPVWVQLNAQALELKAKIKDREEFLKTVRKPDAIRGIEPQTELDEESGELITLYPPTKSSTTTLKFTTRKK